MTAEEFCKRGAVKMADQASAWERLDEIGEVVGTSRGQDPAGGSRPEGHKDVTHNYHLPDKRAYICNTWNIGDNVGAVVDETGDVVELTPESRSALFSIPDGPLYKLMGKEGGIWLIDPSGNMIMAPEMNTINGKKVEIKHGNLVPGETVFRDAVESGFKWGHFMEEINSGMYRGGGRASGEFALKCDKSAEEGADGKCRWAFNNKGSHTMQRISRERLEAYWGEHKGVMTDIENDLAADGLVHENLVEAFWYMRCDLGLSMLQPPSEMFLPIDKKIAMFATPIDVTPWQMHKDSACESEYGSPIKRISISENENSYTIHVTASWGEYTVERSADAIRAADAAALPSRVVRSESSSDSWLSSATLLAQKAAADESFRTKVWDLLMPDGTATGADGRVTKQGPWVEVAVLNFGASPDALAEPMELMVLTHVDSIGALSAADPALKEGEKQDPNARPNVYASISSGMIQPLKKGKLDMGGCKDDGKYTVYKNREMYDAIEQCNMFTKFAKKQGTQNGAEPEEEPEPGAEGAEKEAKDPTVYDRHQWKEMNEDAPEQSKVNFVTYGLWCYCDVWRRFASTCLDPADVAAKDPVLAEKVNAVCARPTLSQPLDADKFVTAVRPKKAPKNSRTATNFHVNLGELSVLKVDADVSEFENEESRKKHEAWLASTRATRATKKAAEKEKNAKKKAKKKAKKAAKLANAKKIVASSRAFEKTMAYLEKVEEGAKSMLEELHAEFAEKETCCCKQAGMWETVAAEVKPMICNLKGGSINAEGDCCKWQHEECDEEIMKWEDSDDDKCESLPEPVDAAGNANAD